MQKRTLRLVRTAPPALAAAAVALALATGACQSRPAGDPNPVRGPADPAGADVIPHAPAADPVVDIPPDLAEVGGRIVVAAVDQALGTAVWELDLASGAALTLWNEPEPVSVSDWAVDPLRARVAYRWVDAGADTRESLVVRDLVPGAPAGVVADTTLEATRLAGLFWLQDGRLAYAIEHASPPLPGSPPPPGSTRYVPESFEIRLALPGAASTSLGTWPLPEREIWSLVSARPDGSAVVNVTDVDGGSLGHAVLVGPDQVVPVVSGAVRTQLAASPSGALVAVLDSAENPPTVALAPVEGPCCRLLATSSDGRMPFGPVWSSDGRYLAWTELRANPVADEIRIRVVDVPAGVGSGADAAAPLGIEVFSRDFPGAASRAFAFSPDGTTLLVALAAPDTYEPDRLAAFRMADGAAVALHLALPPGVWSAAWLPPR